jgi:GTP-binding protein EngB required for normal cell division
MSGAQTTKPKKENMGSSPANMEYGRDWPQIDLPMEEPLATAGLPQTTTGFDVMTLDMTDLVKKIQELSHLGIEDNKIALPKICVVGDQSTGKSSLIEGISEIQVPRSAGTCTRCPMEINLSESKPGEAWKCVIYLSRRYLFDPSKRMRAVPRNAQTLGPWVSIGGRDEEVFITLTDKSHIQNAIKWAQIAILNPNSNSEIYIPGKSQLSDETTAVKFSPNVVRLDISAPGFPTLSFYDLPGVISQPEHDDEKYLVGLVENLVKHYVSQENCIVLLTLTMTDDATNSSAARLIRDIKSAKERTLGVLTKPDRVSQMESFDQWKEILAGEKFKLGHGYFVVRNNQDPTVDHAKARLEEDEFFSDPFWMGMMSQYRDRFGVRRLQTALSTILMHQIQKSLPSIIAKINEKASRIDAELATLPAPPTENYQRILTEKVTMLGMKFRGVFDGGSGYGASSNTLQKFWNRLALDFQKALAITKPTLITATAFDVDIKSERMDSDTDAMVIQTPPRFKRKAPGTDARPQDAQAPANVVTIPEHTYSTKDVFDKWNGASRKFTLGEIREIKEESHRAGIPNQIDPSAIETLNRASVKHWDGVTSAFVVATCNIVMRVLGMNLDEVIAQYHQTGLYRELRRVINEFVTQLRTEFMDDAMSHYQIEHEKPFTMAQSLHKEVQRTTLRGLITGRNRSRARTFLRGAGYDPDDESNIAKTIEKVGPDGYSQEVEMMAVSQQILDSFLPANTFILLELPRILRDCQLPFSGCDLSVGPYQGVLEMP